MDTYEPTIRDALNKAYQKAYKKYLDREITFDEWNRLKHEIKYLLELLIINKIE